jgi:hypothetical protein
MNKEFLEDLIKAQREIKPIPKKGKNPHFKSEYAEYDDVVEACKLACSKHNMFICHKIMTESFPNNGATTTILTTEIHHTSGEAIYSGMPLINKAGTDQGMGSSISYAKRYTLVSLLAVATGDDDDGQKATHSPPHNQSHNHQHAQNQGQYASVPTIDGYLNEEIPPFDELPKTQDGRFKVPDSVLNKIASGDTLHRDGEPEHKWNANKKYPGSFYCSKKLVDNTFCKEQRIEP